MKRIFYVFIVIVALFLTGCADAGKDQLVHSGDLVTLDGSASTPETGGHIKRYRWKQVQGKRVALSGKKKVKATFTAPVVTHPRKLVFRLTTVEVGGRISPIKSRDRVTIKVLPADIDTTPPVITLNGDANLTLNVGDTYTEPDAIAIDDRDGNVSVNIDGVVDTSKVGTYTITYTAIDKAGNSSRKQRAIRVVLPPDTTPPVITLNGDANLTLNVGDTYTELGATATDDRDGNVAVDINGTVDTNQTGNYTVTYTATDKAGNEASKTRVVGVVAKSSIVKDVEEIIKQIEDPSVPYTTDADFNNSMYAKKSKYTKKETDKIIRTHDLVATAKDPDPAWFSTSADKEVIVGKAGEDYVVHLNKARMNGKIIGPVDNDKLRLVVRIQKAAGQYEHIRDIDVDQYASWSGAGILEIHVPDDLEQGRLLVGIRPNFVDVSTTAIAERFSKLLSVEIWKTKDNVKTIEANNVVFPAETTSGFDGNSYFSKDDLYQQAKESLDNNILIFPMIVRDLELKIGDLVTYTYKDKPYAGKITKLIKKQNQTMLLLLPEYTKVYDIVDVNNTEMIDQGLYPEHIVYRQGDKINSAKNEIDTVVFKKLSKAYDESGPYDISCERGDAMLTFEPKFTLYPLSAGVTFSVRATADNVKCKIAAKTFVTTLSPSLATGGIGGLIMKVIGSNITYHYEGSTTIKAEGLPSMGLLAKWDSIRGPKVELLPPLGAAYLGHNSLTDPAAKGKISVIGALKGVYNMNVNIQRNISLQRKTFKMVFAFIRLYGRWIPVYAHFAKQPQRQRRVIRV